jgi:hypothetical protein
MNWLVIPLRAVSLPTAAQINTVPLSNNSDSNAIETKGEAMFDESIESSTRCADLHESRCLAVSILDEFNFRNVSGKPILAFEVTLRYMSSQGSVVENNTLVDTRLFSEQLFESGDVYTLPPNAHGTMILPIRTSEQSRLPIAEVESVFVQFADGTTSGDVEAGEQLRRMLKEELQVLSSLDHMYVSQNRQNFLSSLRNARIPIEFGLSSSNPSDAIEIERVHALVVRAKERLARINLKTTAQSPRTR